MRGKTKASYTPNTDCGDNVIVINAEQVRLTGKKMNNRVHIRHTGYPGGIKGVTAAELLDGEHPERVILKAVERMLPKTKMGRAQIGKLRVYAGTDHPHEAQQPAAIDVGALNPKNKRSA